MINIFEGQYHNLSEVMAENEIAVRGERIFGTNTEGTKEILIYLLSGGINSNIVREHTDTYKLEAVQLAKDISHMGNQRLDENCKKILSNKEIVARILKACLKEYEKVDIGYIVRRCLEDKLYISDLDTINDKTVISDERIVGLNTEDIEGAEGKIVYDIRCSAYIPEDEIKLSGRTRQGMAELMLNIEAQGNFYVGYPLVKRGFYYCSRMISAQKGVEFKGSDYQKLRKVYSIWVCTNVPERLQNTINTYYTVQDSLYGNATEETDNYDLMSVIVICLGKADDLTYIGNEDKKECVELLRLLDLIFVEAKGASEKISIIEKEFGIKMTREVRKEMTDMCNYSEGIYEKGKREGRANVLIELVKKGMLSIEQAANVAKISLEEFMELVDNENK